MRRRTKRRSVSGHNCHKFIDHFQRALGTNYQCTGDRSLVFPLLHSQVAIHGKNLGIYRLSSLPTQGPMEKVRHFFGWIGSSIGVVVLRVVVNGCNFGVEMPHSSFGNVVVISKTISKQAENQRGVGLGHGKTKTNKKNACYSAIF